MSGEIVAKFSDGRLMVHEDAVLDTNYVSGGVKVRVSYLRNVERVLNVNAYFSGVPGTKLNVDLSEVLTSGDSIIPILRRGDLVILSGAGQFASGALAYGVLSGVTSGLPYNGQLTSGKLLSGRLSIAADVVGY